MKLNKEELTLLYNLLSKEETISTISLQNRIKETLEKACEYELCLWALHFDCGRMGSVDGVFKATKKQMELISGSEIHFGEVLGKHSDISGPLEDVDFSLISDNPFVVMEAEESGYNPFDYWYCDECGSEIDWETGKCTDCEGE